LVGFVGQLVEQVRFFPVLLGKGQSSIPHGARVAHIRRAASRSGVPAHFLRTMRSGENGQPSFSGALPNDGHLAIHGGGSADEGRALPHEVSQAFVVLWRPRLVYGTQLRPPISAQISSPRLQKWSLVTAANFSPGLGAFCIPDNVSRHLGFPRPAGRASALHPTEPFASPASRHAAATPW
jgi:hypothetical protein